MTLRQIFVNPAGQDDNLGDSALRVGLLEALRDGGNQLHMHLEGQSSDYDAGIPQRRTDVLYGSHRDWWRANLRAKRSVTVLNAGEINPQPGVGFPNARRAAELRTRTRRGGILIAAGIGLKNPHGITRSTFAPAIQEAELVSWRDQRSRDAAGFGEFAPDWAFALGSGPSSWRSADERPYIAVTMRFDRPWPGDEWCASVRSLAQATGRRIVTVAQVSRDAPLAVRLAEALSGEYLVAASTRHDDMDDHVRRVYGDSLAVISDRAHGLIIGATEGAFPLGTAADPDKIQRLLDCAGVGTLTGHHDGFAERADGLGAALDSLPGAISSSRQRLGELTVKIRSTIDSYFR